MLALALGGRTIAEWQASMTTAEFTSWVAFYRAWPFDDLHRYHRPAALVSTRLGGGEVSQALEWLQPPTPPPGMTLADFNTLRAFGQDPFAEADS